MTSRVTKLVPHVHLGHTTIKLDKPVTKLYKYVHNRSQTGLMPSFRLKPSRARHVSSYFYKTPPDQTKSGLFCKTGRSVVRLDRVVFFVAVFPPARRWVRRPPALVRRRPPDLLPRRPPELVRRRRPELFRWLPADMLRRRPAELLCRRPAVLLRRRRRRLCWMERRRPPLIRALV
jgi:hypothetical protein